MTFKRLSALTEKVRTFIDEKPYEKVVILISFDQLSELRAKCTWQMIVTQEMQEYFIGCQLIMVHDKHDYLAVAYELSGNIYNEQEVKA